MLENQEKDKKQSNYEPIKIPRTFVFDQQIPENEYHLYIDPEEYYNEEFDVCKDEFQNYRSANKNKQMKMLTGIKPKRHKNNRLCLTTQSSNRNPNLAIGKYEILSKKTDIFDSFARKTNMKKENFEIFDKKILSNTNERSECISRVDKYDKSELFEKNDNLWKKDCLIDATTMKKTKTLQDFYKSSTETQPQYKWNKKEMELSREIRDNDKTQILIEKTKRAIRVNEMECAKLKRRVNDENFGNDFIQNKTSIRKSNLALEAVFSENELIDLLNNEELHDGVESLTKIQGGYINRYVDNNSNVGRVKGRSMGYSSKLVEKNYQQVLEKPKKKRKNLTKLSSNNIFKEELRKKKILIEGEAYNLLKGARNKGVFPEQVNQFRINSMKYVKLRTTEKRLQKKVNYQEIIKQLRSKSPKNTSIKKVQKCPSESIFYSPNKESSFHGNFLTEDEKKMLIYIKDVLTKPMNEGNNVVIEQNREVHEGRLLALKRNIVQPEKLNFFSLDKRIQNIKFENLHIQ